MRLVVVGREVLQLLLGVLRMRLRRVMLTLLLRLLMLLLLLLVMMVMSGRVAVDGQVGGRRRRHARHESRRGGHGRMMTKTRGQVSVMATWIDATGQEDVFVARCWWQPL